MCSAGCVGHVSNDVSSLLSSLYLLLAPHAASFESFAGLNMGKVLGHRTMTMGQFDEAFNVPVYGFKDIWEYYSESSSSEFIHGIKVCLSSCHGLLHNNIDFKHNHL